VTQDNEPVASEASEGSAEQTTDRFRMRRRTFLKLSAATGATAAAVYAIGYPHWVPDGIPEAAADEPVVTEFVNTSCLNCPTRCSTTVEVGNGKAVGIHGNPLSEVSDGKICPRGHIGLQVLYDPDRLKRPLKRKAGVSKGSERDLKWDEIWDEIEWNQALEEITGKLNEIRADDPEKLLLLYGLNSTSNEDIIRRFGNAYETPNVVSAEALDNEAEKAGRWMADGNYENIAYDIENTNYILAFGASILESARPLARNLRMWGKIRREKAPRTKVVVIDPRYSLTASKADEWIPINPGTDAALAMGIAHVIIRDGLHDESFVNDSTSGFAEYSNLATSDEYSPENVAAITGISAATIQRLATEFAQAKPAIAWAGRGPCNRPNGSYNAYAIFCLNALVGSIGVEGGIIYQEVPQYRDDNPLSNATGNRLDDAGTTKFPGAEVVTNQVPNAEPNSIGMAIGFNCNFNMSAPWTARWDTLLADRVPYYVHVGSVPSEMAQYADIILPTGTFLEEWAYDHCPAGPGFAEVKLKQPVVDPLYDTKSVFEIVLALANGMGDPVSPHFTDVGENAKEFVRYRTSDLLANSGMTWEDFTGKRMTEEEYEQDNKGGCLKIEPTQDNYQYGNTSQTFEFSSDTLRERYTTLGLSTSNNLDFLPHYVEPEFMGDEEDYPFVLIPYQPVLNIENGSQNYPWAQEIYMVMHGLGWNNFVEINKETAKHRGIHDGDTLWVESKIGEIKMKAKVIEGIHPETMAIAIGQGHYRYGEWQKNIGANPNEILVVEGENGFDKISGQSAFFNTRVQVRKA
jgi:thiosulfate reductase/polysulfide reductase chain A